MNIISIVFVVVFMNLCAGEQTNRTFTLEYQWSFINFTWNDNAKYQDAITSGKYIPENNAMAGIKFYKDKFYIAIPRIREGTPVTLGYITTDSNKINPLVTPFPNWESNDLGDCNNLESVQSMEIDKCGTMWVLDGFRITPSFKCPPKLVLFDLNDNGKVVHRFEFPEQICLSRGGFLNDLVIDGDFAYITDNGNIDPGLIVYSRSKNRAWKIRDPSMFAENDAVNYTVNGLPFTNLAPIDGIALSPCQGTTRYVFYCALTGLNLYAINTDVLKNEELCSGGNWRKYVNLVGKKQAQSDGMVVDNEGNLYYGLLPLYGVGKWNIHQPFSSSAIIDRNRDTMVWTDSFTFDDKGYLYLLANNINRFFDSNYKLRLTDEVKFNILKLYTSTRSYLHPSSE